jgi:phage-related minor tail protein
MATTVARLEAVLSADTRQFDQSMDRSHGTLGKFGKAALVAGGVLGGALAIGLKRGADEMMESQRVTAQTNAVLKSTGGIANVTAKEVEKLAGSLSKKTGVDDEVIQSGENILLTFTRIRNETGKGNDIFNQATKATLDLSVAMHKDLNSAAVLVGKALNDPLKGLTALQRVGVTFSAQQKEQIKHLVDTGTAAKKAAKDVQEAAARVTAAQSAQETAARAVASAQEALRNAQNQVRASQEALIESNRQIKDAMDKVKEATHGVTEAKEALRDAQIKARDAQIALTDARRAARDELENLRASTVDAALSEEQAELSLARAKEHLEEVNKDANATELDRRQAALDVKKAEDNLRDAHRDRERAMRDLDAAEKKGIEGSKRVIDAKRGIKEADEGVSDAAYNVQKAQRDVQRAQEDVAKAHRDAEKAQQRVAEAQHDASVAAGKLADAQGKQATANAALSKAQADLANAQKRVKETAGDSSNILAAQKLILAELKKEFGGSAEAAGDTFGGQLDKLKNRLDENLGSLVAQASQVGILIVAFGSLASMVSGTVIATAALTAGTWLLSAAMTALPIIGWISAFVLLGVALTVLYKKSETFRNAVNFLKAN